MKKNTLKKAKEIISLVIKIGLFIMKIIKFINSLS